MTPFERFLRVLEEHAPKQPARPWRTHALAMRRAAFKLERYAVLSCNRELRRFEELDDTRATILFEELCAEVGCTARFGDPRGYVAHIVFPDGYCNTFGGPEAGYGCTEE